MNEQVRVNLTEVSHAYYKASKFLLYKHVHLWIDCERTITQSNLPWDQRTFRPAVKPCRKYVIKGGCIKRFALRKSVSLLNSKKHLLDRFERYVF